MSCMWSGPHRFCSVGTVYVWFMLILKLLVSTFPKRCILQTGGTFTTGMFANIWNENARSQMDFLWSIASVGEKPENEGALIWSTCFLCEPPLVDCIYWLLKIHRRTLLQCRCQPRKLHCPLSPAMALLLETCFSFSWSCIESCVDCHSAPRLLNKKGFLMFFLCSFVEGLRCLRLLEAFA